MKAKNITPDKSLCGVAECPSVFETDRNSYLVVGTVPAMRDLPRCVLKKLGKGEVVVEVPRGTLER